MERAKTELNPERFMEHIFSELTLKNKIAVMARALLLREQQNLERNKNSDNPNRSDGL